MVVLRTGQRPAQPRDIRADRDPRTRWRIGALHLVDQLFGRDSLPLPATTTAPAAPAAEAPPGLSHAHPPVADQAEHRELHRHSHHPYRCHSSDLAPLLRPADPRRRPARRGAKTGCSRHLGTSGERHGLVRTSSRVTRGPTMGSWALSFSSSERAASVIPMRSLRGSPLDTARDSAVPASLPKTGASLRAVP